MRGPTSSSRVAGWDGHSAAAAAPPAAVGACPVALLRGLQLCSQAICVCREVSGAAQAACCTWGARTGADPPACSGRLPLAMLKRLAGG